MDGVQQDLFEHVLEAYAAAGGVLSNQALYRDLSDRASIPASAWEQRLASDPKGSHSHLKHGIRWLQQSAKHQGLLERDQARGRGFWRITPKGRRKLTPAAPRTVMLGYSTNLGIALWGSAGDVFSAIDEPISLCLTSPPYPLARPRDYGNPTTGEYVDWVCKLLEPIAKHLVPGGSIALNISNDIFEPGSPARSLYREELIIALCRRLSLFKIDELIWESNKPPGPLRWASITHQQLNVAWEPVYVFSNVPTLLRADNRRVLQEHTERHLALIRRGGEKRTATYGDGAYRIREGSYGRETAGRIARNVLKFSNRCTDRDATRRAAKAQGLPMHGATMPLKLARFLVEYLSEEGDLVVDTCAGWGTTAKAAEITNRRWCVSELNAEYVLGGANRFREALGFQLYGGLA